jgi:hypothetical protein
MACLIHPNAIEDISRVDRLVAIVEKDAATHQYGNWFYRAIGLHAYRNGNYQAAVDTCITSRNLKAQQRPAVLVVADHVIESMAHFQLGDKEKAGQSLAATENEFDNNLPIPGVEDMSYFWHDWLIARILYRKAIALVIATAKPE